MIRILGLYIPAFLFVLACFCVLFFSEPMALMKTYISGMNILSYIAYVLILVAAVVLMPLTVMPLIPLAASVLGPFATAILSIFGWTIGAMIAFLIARHLGRPILEKFTSLEKLDALLELFPKDTRFLFIVLLRLTLPVDLVSYALGLTKSLGFIEYSLATFVGVIWFSFAFAYLGDALLTGNTPLLIELGGLSLVIFLIGWYLLKRSQN